MSIQEVHHIIARTTDPDAAKWCCDYLNDRFPPGDFFYKQAGCETYEGLSAFHVVIVGRFVNGMIEAARGFLQGYRRHKEIS